MNPYVIVAVVFAVWFATVCGYTIVRTLLAARDGSEYL